MVRMLKVKVARQFPERRVSTKNHSEALEDTDRQRYQRFRVIKKSRHTTSCLIYDGSTVLPRWFSG